ncbi:peptidoglycan recognition protein family protein [Camelimonas lactis]|uniref:Putative peptidoglycan binding protein n=1 Tax=Camelimonas lactis TaxID=659006 RepID=A0A4R2GW19_9HYPH|nr:N-acetylmuramoyl-L-alanine amidase [Camelimonas lactis]TCO15200.1 putative peptidoglycan binding protein [Camelimonas lactis]
MDVEDLQRSLQAIGLYTRNIDNDFGGYTLSALKQFQVKSGLEGDPILPGARTLEALDRAVAAKIAKPANDTIPADWLPDAQMLRVILHWTAGTGTASENDRDHYHVLIDASPKLVRGLRSIDQNDARGLKARYAPHTLNCNSGSIGIAICGMAGAVEQPFSPGRYPITRAQWDLAARAVAVLCRRYRITVSPKTVLSHAEVQGTLGIVQRGKWDIARLPWDPSVAGAKAVGDLFRAAVIAA